MSSSHDMTSTHCDSRCHALAADLLPRRSVGAHIPRAGECSTAHTYLGPGNVQRREDPRVRVRFVLRSTAANLAARRDADAGRRDADARLSVCVSIPRGSGGGLRKYRAPGSHGHLHRRLHWHPGPRLYVATREWTLLRRMEQRSREPHRTALLPARQQVGPCSASQDNAQSGAPERMQEQREERETITLTRSRADGEQHAWRAEVRSTQAALECAKRGFKCIYAASLPEVTARICEWRQAPAP